LFCRAGEQEFFQLERLNLLYVIDIKKHLSSRLHQTSSFITLAFGNLVLENHRHFASYNITSGSIVHAILPLSLQLFIQNARGA
jgi:hypothetical protein